MDGVVMSQSPNAEAWMRAQQASHPQFGRFMSDIGDLPFEMPQSGTAPEPAQPIWRLSTTVTCVTGGLLADATSQ
jgi:hypothetical protein